MGRLPIFAANSRVLLFGVLLEESTPAMESSTSIVAPLVTLSGDPTYHASVYPWVNQLEQEGPGPAMTTILIEFCVCRYCEPSTGDRRFFFLTLFLF